MNKQTVNLSKPRDVEGNCVPDSVRDNAPSKGFALGCWIVVLLSIYPLIMLAEWIMTW